MRGTLIRMDWSMRRKVIYGVTTLFFFMAVGAFLFQNILFPDPTCFDNEKNGYESGIDCGGTCSLKCSSEVMPIKVLWSRALPAGEGRYDFVSLIENKNIDNAPRDVGFSFSAYSREGAEVFSYTGTTTISVEDEKPIILADQIVNGIPDRVVLTLFPAYHYAAKERPKTTLVRTVRVRHEEGDISRAYVTVKNMTQKTFVDLPVRVVLYDAQRNAIAAGETRIKLLGPEEEPELVFTWKVPFDGDVASTVVYYDFKSF